MKVYAYVSLLLSTLALGGCQTAGTTRWMQYAPGPDLEYSKAECAIGAMGVEKDMVAWGRPGYVLGAQLGNAIGNEIRKAEYTEHCMTMHGWRKVREPDGAQPTQAADPRTAPGADRMMPAMRRSPATPMQQLQRPPTSLVAG